LKVANPVIDKNFLFLSLPSPDMTPIRQSAIPFRLLGIIWYLYSPILIQINLVFCIE